MEFFRESFRFLGDRAGDFSFLLLFVGMSLATGFLFGRWKLINILINIYIALAFVGVLSTGGFLEFSDYGRLIAFVVVLVFLTATDERLFDLHITSAGTDFFWRLFVMSILVTGFFASSLFSLVPEKELLSYVSSSVYMVFASPLAQLVWMVLPIASLFFINNRLK